MRAMTRPKTQPRQRRQRGTGGVRLRLDGRWEATATLEKDGSSSRGRRLSGYGASSTAALADLERKRADARSGLDSAGAHTSIAEWLVLVMDSKPKLAYATKRGYWQSIDSYLIPELGKATLATCSPKMIQAKIDKIAREHGPSAAHHAHATLRMALSMAERLEMVTRNAAKLVVPPEQDRDTPVPWAIDEARAFLKAIKGHHLQALFHIAATSGPRPSELLGLRWASVETATRKITIVEKLVTPRVSDGEPHTAAPKSVAGTRSFTLTPKTMEILEEHRAQQAVAKAKSGERWVERDRVFCGPHGGPLRVDGTNHTFHDILEAHEIRHIRPYDLRRLSSALILAGTGGNHQEVKEQLGHSTILLGADRYAYRLQATMDATARAVDDVLDDASVTELEYPDEDADVPD
jgi:integrase